MSRAEDGWQGMCQAQRHRFYLNVSRLPSMDWLVLPGSFSTVLPLKICRSPQKERIGPWPFQSHHASEAKLWKTSGWIPVDFFVLGKLFWGKKTSPAYQNPIKLRLIVFFVVDVNHLSTLSNLLGKNLEISRLHMPSPIYRPFRSSFHPIASCSSRPSIKSVLGPISTATQRQKGSCSILIIYNNVAGCVSKLQAFADFSLKPTTFKLV